MRTILRLTLALTITIALTGCASGLFGGGNGSTLGDGKIDLVTVIGLAASAQAGDYSLLCETMLAAQPKASATEKGLLQAACLGLLGSAVTGASPVPPPRSVVAGSALSGDACANLEVAFALAQDACGWQE
jgi:hypothetical protein